MTDQPHTPTTTDILGTYIQHMTRHGDVSVEEVRAEFFRWLTAHDESIREEEREDIAAAEQRGAARALRDVMEVHQKTEHQRAYGFPRADKWEHYCMEDNQSWPCPTVQAITDAMNGATNA